MKKILCLVTMFSCLVCIPRLEGAELNFNIVNLQANAAQQVDNDVMVVTMSASSEADSAQEAAQKVNDMMAWAGDIARNNTTVKSRTLNYQTRPLYSNKTLVGWAADQQIRFESLEFAELSNLVGTLQQKLRVISMLFEVSPGEQENNVNKLISRALAAFRKKAGLISKTLGAKDYRIVTISIRENGPAVPLRRAYQAEMMSTSTSSAPHVEAGESRVTVTAEGAIQLVF